ncbi:MULTISPECIES: DUF4296 domain-containing protein [Weeksella]|uniref:DUF4296 domain-containing protein n=1 Tax=Weeksella virosa (strain ATCC 43766 / DSM 16922 / JCM 21250 / CCUG 30538 / CDC 9751 / IAM 14551 / NBRC 16016 / NCTC 11634 / CL345/78) TaxID=865938 RepID=F0NXI8_WEEVC|nr:MULTISPECIES: DUF4296 domain-containing protein [Weeksella]ADX67978.1 hypothetical protein Weevi_1274 [Weeksella virosa DSM 16922]MDK7375789.1 DUF4296 domain-containing protein [Weeksella virosa]MDK7676157.1 DUF4296 domain-containing protein [Weeksella virosa]OFM83771.1 hypothetical protein HMPREF2660_09590 [Weeksella sp. HMSC059D05]SUP54286.1 Uncharacterised protein [Weeksella virosa]
MRKTLSIVLLSFVFLACEEANIPKPNNLVSKKEMTSLMSDLYLHQTMMQNAYENQDIKSYAQNALAVLKNHNITLEAFEASYEYYNSNPTLYKAILKNAKDQLVNKLPKEEKEKYLQTQQEILQQEEERKRREKLQF